MQNNEIWMKFFLHMGKILDPNIKIENCRDVDKWTDELQESWRKQDEIKERNDNFHNITADDFFNSDREFNGILNMVI